MAENERVELKLVEDWNSIPDGNAVSLDLTEDAWEYGAPPPRGVYDFKLFPAKETVKMGLSDPKDPKSIYFSIGYEAKIVSDNEDYNGITAFGNLTTRIYRGKGISTAAGLLVKMGFKVPNPISDKKLAQMVALALTKEKIVKGELDWRGAYSYKDPKTGNDVWENVYNHYEDFPADTEKGGRKHMVSVASKGGGMAEVRAQVRILRFFGPGDKLPTFVGGAQLVSAPKSVIQAPQMVPTVVPVTQTVPVNAAPSFVAPPANGAAGDEDLELLLSQ